MNPIKTVAILGAGTMGHGIAQVSALAGCRTHLRDMTSDILHRAVENVKASLAKGVEKGKLSAEARESALLLISTTTSIADAVRDTDLVIEAIPENMPLKKELFASLDQMCPAGTLLATNTSSLSITEIAAAAKRPDRVVGLHFFNPVPIMELVEIVVGQNTADETLERAKAYVTALGKTAIVVRDSP